MAGGLEKYTRKDFLKCAAGTVGGFAIGSIAGYSCGVRQEKEIEKPITKATAVPTTVTKPDTKPTQAPTVKEPSPTVLPTVIARQAPEPDFEEDMQRIPGKIEVLKQPENAVLKIKFGKEQKVDLSPLRWVPDGRTSFLRKDKDLTMIVSSGVDSYALKGTVNGRSVEGLHIVNNGKPILSPNPANKWEQHYAGITSFVKDGKGGFIGVYHAEDRKNKNDGGNFVASIGLVYSNDLINWERRGRVLEGVETNRNDKNVFGIGQPMLFEPKDSEYYYLYYVDWTFGTDAIHLARCPKNEIGSTRAWQKWIGDRFGKSGEMRSSEPVIDHLKFKDGGNYAALPSISYNTKLRKYLAIVQAGNYSFGSVVSNDGIKWESPQILLKNKLPKYERWYDGYYAAPASFDEESDQKTNDQGILIYGSSENPNKPHTMVYRPWKIG